LLIAMRATACPLRDELTFLARSTQH